MSDTCRGDLFALKINCEQVLEIGLVHILLEHFLCFLVRDYLSFAVKVFGLGAKLLQKGVHDLLRDVHQFVARFFVLR